MNKYEMECGEAYEEYAGGHYSPLQSSGLHSGIHQKCFHNFSFECHVKFHFRIFSVKYLVNSLIYEHVKRQPKNFPLEKNSSTCGSVINGAPKLNLIEQSNTNTNFFAASFINNFDKKEPYN